MALLDRAVQGDNPSVVAMVGRRQGKTAIVQHWLAGVRERAMDIEGVFLWCFYRGKDSDFACANCLRGAEQLSAAPRYPPASASIASSHFAARALGDRADGTEVVQHEQGEWFGRFVHPELGRLNR